MGIAKIHTFEISHKGLGSAVQSIDDHLPVSRTSDLNASVLQAWCGGCTVPRRLSANVGGLSWEVECDARVKAALGVLASNEKALAGCLECAMKGGEELERAVCEELSLLPWRRLWSVF